jgi:hypothetical protein
MVEKTNYLPGIVSPPLPNKIYCETDRTECEISSRPIDNVYVKSCIKCSEVCKREIGL